MEARPGVEDPPADAFRGGPPRGGAGAGFADGAPRERGAGRLVGGAGRLRLRARRRAQNALQGPGLRRALLPSEHRRLPVRGGVRPRVRPPLRGADDGRRKAGARQGARARRGRGGPRRDPDRQRPRRRGQGLRRPPRRQGAGGVNGGALPHGELSGGRQRRGRLRERNERRVQGGRAAEDARVDSRGRCDNHHRARSGKTRAQARLPGDAPRHAARVRGAGHGGQQGHGRQRRGLAGGGHRHDGKRRQDYRIHRPSVPPPRHGLGALRQEPAQLCQLPRGHCKSRRRAFFQGPGAVARNARGRGRELHAGRLAALH
mmetsp:Transcript_15976/g.37065  ORF Transcript_15976/g.37065 Transcript_15976/m.37065 type:complete len:317 (+) Transcript_15976:445-1395(+)